MTHPAFDDQPTLTGAALSMRPLAREDREGLHAAASDPKTWAAHPVPDRHERAVFDPYFDFLIRSGGALAAVDNASGAIIGCSRYYVSPDEPHSISIGFTFLAPRYWGGARNREMKRLMLEHAFETFDAVWLHIGPDNIRSRRAAEKIGATHIRDDRLTLSGGEADFACYRITREEWNERR